VGIISDACRACHAGRVFERDLFPFAAGIGQRRDAFRPLGVAVEGPEGSETVLEAEETPGALAVRFGMATWGS
jgi:hypothetical protein